MPRIAPAPLIRGPLGRLTDSSAHWYYLAAGGLSDTNVAPRRDVLDLMTGQVGTRSGPGIVYGDGPYGRCLVSDGNNLVNLDTITFAPGYSSAPFTITCTVYLAGNTTGFFCAGGGGGQGFGLGVGTDDVGTSGNDLIMFLGGVPYVLPRVPIGFGWHTVTGTYSALDVRFYVDGRLVSSMPSVAYAFPLPGSGSALGGAVTVPFAPYCFNGKIADAKIYSYAQTTAEVARDHADPFWRLRPYPVTLEWFGLSQNPLTLGAVAGPASASLSLQAQPPPRMATLAAQASPASIAWTIDGGSLGPLVIGDFTSVLAPVSDPVNPWGIDPDETVLVN